MSQSQVPNLVRLPAQMPAVPEREDSGRAFIAEWYCRPIHLLRPSGMDFDEPLVPRTRRRSDDGAGLAYMKQVQVLSDGLHEDMPGIDRAHTAGADPGLVVRGLYQGEVGSVVADMRVGQSADPDARSLGNCLVGLEGRTLFTGEELFVVVARLDRLEDHRAKNGPLGQQFHAARVDADRLVEKHRFEPGFALVLNPAHPLVVASVANGINFLLGILAVDHRPVRFLNVDRCELHQPVHPVRPKVLLAPGFVVAKDARWSHTRSILAEMWSDANPYTVHRIMIGV